MTDEGGLVVTRENSAWLKEEFEKNMSYDAACRRELRDLLRYVAQKAAAQVSRSADTKCSAFADTYSKVAATKDRHVANKVQEALHLAERH